MDDVITDLFYSCDKLLLVCALAAFALTSCDTLGPGYVNRLGQPITIVENGYDRPNPRALKPGEIGDPAFGGNPHSIDVLGRDGRVIAHYQYRDIPRTGARDGIEWVIITADGAIIERKAHIRERP